MATRLHITAEDGSVDLWVASDERLGQMFLGLCSPRLARKLPLYTHGKLILSFGQGCEIVQWIEAVDRDCSH